MFTERLLPWPGVNIERNEYIGKKYGQLTVLSKVGKTKNRKYKYKCRCDCGEISIAQINNLKSGHTKSCGCLGLEVKRDNGANRSFDLAGQVFGDLTAIRENGKNRKGEIIWIFRCNKCGREKSVVGRFVRERPEVRRCDCGEAQAKTLKTKGQERRKKPRDNEEFAQDIYCCYVKQGMSLRDAATEEGYSRSNMLSWLLLNYVSKYKEASIERRKISESVRYAKKARKKSKLFKTESDFVDVCLKKLKEHGINGEVNNRTESGFEIDILTTRYCYEAKIEVRIKSIFTAIGQLFINADKTGLIPALVIPSDVAINLEQEAYLKRNGVEIFNENDIVSGWDD